VPSPSAVLSHRGRAVARRVVLSHLLGGV